jgi:hypothetical protein
MSHARLVPVVLVAVLVAVAAAQAATPTNECNGIRECQRAHGPWVYIPAGKTAVYLLDCPLRRGIVGGADALASSTAVHVWFDAQLGAPVGPGRTTTRYGFFRARLDTNRPGFFQPRIGCIPTNPSARATTAVKAYPGPPLALAAANLRLRPGTVRTSTIGCVGGQRLVDSWTAIAFRTPRMPDVALAEGIRVTRTVQGKKVAVSIATSEALPGGSRAEVQLGVACAQS